MSTPMRRRWAALVVLAAASTLPGQAPARPVLDDAWLRGVVARVRPAVERACGRQFQKPPVVGLADAGDVIRALRDDLEPGVAAFHAGQPRARIQRALQLRADLLGAAMLGKYGFASGEVYVLPHLAAMNLGFVHRGDAPLDQVMELVVAHELVHALQDQEIGLGRRVRECSDSDGSDALAMLVEGHAVFCSERAAAELGLLAAIPPLRAVFAGDKDPAAIGKADLATRRLRGLGVLQYVRGAEFMAAEHAAGGDARLWQLLAMANPRTRPILLGTATAAAVAANLVPAVAGLDERLAGRTWTVGRGSLSDRLLLGENLPRGADLLALLPSLVGSAEWFAMAPTPASWRAVYVLSFADAAAATGFCALAEDVATSDMKGTALTFTSAPGPAWEGAESRRLSQGPNGTVPVAASAQLWWVRDGRHVLQLTCVNAPLDDAALAGVAHHVLSRLGR